MTDISRESLDGHVVLDREAAKKHGKGAIYYAYARDSERQFPKDVTHVYIVMPLTMAQAYPDKSEDMVSPYKDEFVVIPWDVDHCQNPDGYRRWKLSGTYEAPSLAPSLNYIGRWHGHLLNGRLESC